MNIISANIAILDMEHMYNLTDNQKDLLRWIIDEVRNGILKEEFTVVWLGDSGIISSFNGKKPDKIVITSGALDAFESNELMLCDRRYRTSTQSKYVRQKEVNRKCTLTKYAFDAVDSDFDSPDTSFIKQLTPLADISNLDKEIKKRCLPILGAGSADPTLWDSAIRTAGVILEERLRDIGGIVDNSRVGRDLVNDVFGNSGTLKSKFNIDSERVGYRDLYAGIVGAFRNPYSHRFIDPLPEDGGAFIVFVNLLLKMLEDLR